jgi:methylmalonyl-CoA mutase N-terminal domain/subunit
MEKERKIMSGERRVVGVNCYQTEEEHYKPPVFRAREAYEIAKARHDKLIQERDNRKAHKAIDRLHRAMESNENVMLPMMEAVKVGVTSSEIGNLQREVFGVWKPPLPI